MRWSQYRLIFIMEISIPVNWVFICIEKRAHILGTLKIPPITWEFPLWQKVSRQGWWKEIEYQIWSSQTCKGFLLPLPCSWCYEWYHIVFLCWICIECMSPEPLWKMYLHGNIEFLHHSYLTGDPRDLIDTFAKACTCMSLMEKFKL